MNRELTLSWTIDAAPADVFRAWTDPAHLEWFYNDNQPIPDAPIEVDLRVGGAWRQLMVIDHETQYVTGGIYREIVPTERLVFTFGAVGGWPALDLDALEDSPLVTLTFSEHTGGTRLTLHMQLPEAFVDAVGETMVARMDQGWRDTVGRLVDSSLSRQGSVA